MGTKIGSATSVSLEMIGLFFLFFNVNACAINGKEPNFMALKDGIQLILDCKEDCFVGQFLELHVEVRNISSHSAEIFQPVLGKDLAVFAGERPQSMSSLKERKLLHPASPSEKIILKSHEKYQFKILLDPSVYILPEKMKQCYLMIKYFPYLSKDEQIVIESNVISCAL